MIHIFPQATVFINKTMQVTEKDSWGIEREVYLNQGQNFDVSELKVYDLIGRVKFKMINGCEYLNVIHDNISVAV